MATKENPELTKEEKFNVEEFWKDVLPNKPSPPTEIKTYNSRISTIYEPTNYNNRSYSSGYPGGYHSSVGNLNGSSGFSQSGGGHSNFFATAKSWR